MPDLRVHQVHLSHAALILLEGRDSFRIRRPLYDRAIAIRPTRIVRGVSEILDAVRGELRLLACRNLARPQVVIANEHHAFLIRRNRLDRSVTTSPSTASTS